MSKAYYDKRTELLQSDPVLTDYIDMASQVLSAYTGGSKSAEDALAELDEIKDIKLNAGLAMQPNACSRCAELIRLAKLHIIGEEE